MNAYKDGAIAAKNRQLSFDNPRPIFSFFKQNSSSIGTPSDFGLSRAQTYPIDDIVDCVLEIDDPIGTLSSISCSNCRLLKIGTINTNSTAATNDRPPASTNVRLSALDLILLIAQFSMIYSGKLSCFFIGISTCLSFSIASARAILRLVECGMMTSSI